MDEEEITKDELVVELDSRYEPKHKEQEAEKTKKTPVKNTLIIIGIIILLVGIFFYDDLEVRYNEYFKEETVEILTPAEVELYRFSDLKSNISVNVEISIINIGETTAKDISVFVRARNQNGTILFSGNLSTIVLLLRENETCSAVYSVPYDINDTKVLHTMEIEWTAGRTSYYKETIL